MNNVSRSALVAAISAALAAGTLHSATFDVTNTDDAGPGSLRQALIDANANAEADTIDLSSISGQTITLSSGELYTSFDDITINGFDVTIDANQTSRVLRAYYSDITINDLTITGGFLENDAERGVPADYGGAGINAALSSLVINNSVITGNESETAGGGVIAFVPLENRGSGGYNASLELNDSIISGNTATDLGGGLVTYLGNGNVTISNSQITGNEVSGIASPRFSGIGVSDTVFANRIISGLNRGVGSAYGTGAGAVLISAYGDVTVENTTITENNADLGSIGGALLTSGSGDVSLNQSTVANNSAFDIGGLQMQGKYAVEISNSTVSGNSAADILGGAVLFAGGGSGIRGSSEALLVQFTTITNNSSAIEFGGLAVETVDNPALIIGSVLSGNTAPIGPDLVISDGDGFNGNVDMEWSLIGIDPTTGTLNKDVTSMNLTGVDPQIAALGNNGGSTETHLPFAGSPLLDQLPNASGGCGTQFTNDQRGQVRPQNGACDIGSVEGFGAGLPESVPVPVLDRVGLMLMGGLLALAGLFGLRRRLRSRV